MQGFQVEVSVSQWLRGKVFDLSGGQLTSVFNATITAADLEAAVTQVKNHLDALLTARRRVEQDQKDKVILEQAEKERQERLGGWEEKATAEEMQKRKIRNPVTVTGPPKDNPFVEQQEEKEPYEPEHEGPR